LPSSSRHAANNGTALVCTVFNLLLGGLLLIVGHFMMTMATFDCDPLHWSDVYRSVTVGKDQMKKYLRLMVLIVAAVGFLSGCNQDTPPRGVSSHHPIRWTEYIPMGSLGDIDALLDTAVDVGQNDGLMMERTTADGNVLSKQVVTGREYLDLSAQGYQHDETTYAFSISSWYVKAVGWVPYLFGAEPAVTSFVQDLDFEAITIADLPWELTPLLEGSPDSEDASWLDADPEAVVVRATPDKIEVVGGGTRSTLTIVAWADFTGDGIEDVLLYRTCHATEGTYRVYHYCVLTKLDDSGPLRMISISYPELLDRWYRTSSH
jgi:hypothetical protein